MEKEFLTVRFNKAIVMEWLQKDGATDGNKN